MPRRWFTSRRRAAARYAAEPAGAAALRTRFAKSRQVPLHASTAKASGRYRWTRDGAGTSGDDDAPFFIGARGRLLGRRISVHLVNNVFAKLRNVADSEALELDVRRLQTRERLLLRLRLCGETRLVSEASTGAWLPLVIKAESGHRQSGGLLVAGEGHATGPATVCTGR